ncbi:nuclear pore complex protein Nup153-like [Sorex araneus]|uniref:nuclear pore complex protein Nup153-like n=1 Tax=Sorex araneus TaxID=42254 RepID=UPI0024335F57|nr:nuclear pore complex protein Nup153-like [Sorex araneus]
MREDATCAICLKLMTEPVIIDCGHSYCRVCIEGTTESKPVTLSQRTSFCPQCQTQVNNVSLRPNKQLQNLIETVKEMGLEDLCEEHGEPLCLFCEDDGQLICWCCERSPQHKTHVTLLVSDACLVYKKILQKTVGKLKELENQCNSMKTSTDKHKFEYMWKIGIQQAKTRHDFKNLKTFLCEEEKCHLWRLEGEREKVLKRLQDGEASLEKQSQDLQTHILQLEEKCRAPAKTLLWDVKDTLNRSSTVTLELPETVSLSLDETCNVSELYFDVKKITKGNQGSSGSASSHGSIPISQSSGIRPGLDKKPEGSWDCDICLVRNNAHCTKCVACESSRPSTQAEGKGFGISFSSMNSAASAFKFGIPSFSPGSTQTALNTENFKSGDQGGFKVGVSTDSGSRNPMNFNFSKATGDFKFGISCDSKPEEAKDSQNNNNLKFGLFTSLSNPASVTPFQFGACNLGQQVKKEERPKPSPADFIFGAATAKSTVISDRKSEFSSGTLKNKSDSKTKFSFGTLENKSDSGSPFTWKMPEAKTESSGAKAGCTSGNTVPTSLPSAPLFVLGRTGEKQEPVTSTSQVFGKSTDNKEPKCQSVFSFGRSEQTKGESTFSVGTAKPREKEIQQPEKATFAFGDQRDNTAGAAKPVFRFSDSNSSNSSTAAASPGGGLIGGFATSSTAPGVAFSFGQSSGTAGGFAFGNSSESSTSQSSLFPQESKPGPNLLFGCSRTSSNFPTTHNNHNPCGAFTFGANQKVPAASAPPSGSGAFTLNQAPAAFTMGSNGQNVFSSGTPLSGCKKRTNIRSKKQRSR